MFYNDNGDGMKKYIEDVEVKNKTVIVRCDFNVPIKNGKIIDDSKIIASLETIEYLRKENAKIIILSHFGKVHSKEDKINNSLEPVAKHLQSLLQSKVIFSKTTRDIELTKRIQKLQPGEIILLENTRFEDLNGNLESENDPQLALYWAELADIYCLDAFASSHRKHASTYGIADYIPSCLGFLIKHELENLDSKVLNAEKPFTILMGGSKIEDKLPLMEKLLPKCDNLLIIGALANTCLKVLGFNIGASICSKDEMVIEKIKNMLINNREKIMLPVDVVVSKVYDSEKIEHINVDKITNDDIIYDIGMKTVQKYKEVIDQSTTIFVNGTCGKYEDVKFATGTREMLTNIGNSSSVKVVGGGDGVSAVNFFKLQDKFDFLSTGGGATLEYIINETLPAIEHINDYEN